MISAQQSHSLTKSHFALLFFSALFVRFLLFFSYVQYDERYQQPDSMDYHNCALALYCGTGMHRPDNHEPIFWRTPGYPLFLAPFYMYYHINKGAFSAWKPAHITIIIVQIILCSLIPILIWLLAQLLTANVIIASIAAWISVFHIGFILASMYILTEGISVIFFLLFLYFFYKTLREKYFSSIVFAALSLGIYTWMRPMGQFVAVVSILLLFFVSQISWQHKVKNSLLFALIFFASIAPWYIRNHNLTGQWFFCPMSGPYLNSFCAPKILREVKGLTLEQSIRLLYSIAELQNKEAKKTLVDTGLYAPRELACNNVAMPIIQQHPFIFAKYWIIEVLKTTFDLYSYQLVALATNTFRYDPLEEFLSEKLVACFYAASIPWWMRTIVYLEFVYELFLWIGLFSGIIIFMLIPLIRLLKKTHPSRKIREYEILWWQTLPLIIATLAMTGGFGYARLRLPIEALMIILSLTWWFYVYQLFHKNKKTTIL